MRWFAGLTGSGKVAAIIAGGFLSLMLLGGVASAVDGSDPKPDGPDTSSLVEPAPSPEKPATSKAPEPVVEVRQETATEAVPFTSSTVDDATMARGSTGTRVAGVAGVLTRTFEVTVTDGVETGRVEISSVVTTPPVHEVIARGTKAPAPAPAAPAPIAAAPAPSDCPNGTYTNTAGNSVCRPYESAQVPAGATAQCRDNTYSSSQNRSGTCSGHGGVARWL